MYCPVALILSQQAAEGSDEANCKLIDSVQDFQSVGSFGLSGGCECKTTKNTSGGY